ncbi:hypothetical protein KDD93_09225, partial [Campylobacter sp. faydin G-24]
MRIKDIAKFTTHHKTKTTKSHLGNISKSFIDKTQTNTNLKQSSLNTNNLNLSANTINLISSNIQAGVADINTEILNLISGKSSSIKTELKQSSGLITATITDKGKIKDIEIPTIIKVKDKFILNGKDITHKLDTSIANEISKSLDPTILSENIIKELRSNPTNPIDEKTINQIKAILNSKEWENKTTTLSTIGSLIITIAMTYLTAGVGDVAASSLGLASGTASAASVSAMTSAL